MNEFSEPWKHNRFSATINSVEYVFDSIWDSNNKLVMEFQCRTASTMAAFEQGERATRIVTCVNAMYGIKDPESHMKRPSGREIGTAISDSQPDPNNPGQHVVDVELFKHPADYGR